VGAAGKLHRIENRLLNKAEGGEVVMTKADMIAAVAKAAKLSKRAGENAVDATFENLARALKKEKRFQVAGFGTFSVRSRKARKGRISRPAGPSGSSLRRP
jgi:nucleoid DNA-binding protein